MITEIETAWLILEANLKQASLQGYRAEYDWLGLYQNIISAAKRHAYLHTLFPLTSHYCLRFSVDEELRESWPSTPLSLPRI